MASQGMQHQRHGVTKNLVESVGGFIAVAALVVLIGNLFKKNPRANQPPETASTDALTGEAEGRT